MFNFNSDWEKANYEHNAMLLYSIGMAKTKNTIPSVAGTFINSWWDCKLV